MAASYTYGVTASHVLSEVAANSHNLTATSGKVSSTDVDRWINAAAGKLNAVAKKSGVDVGASMDVDAHEALADAVRAFAAAMVYGSMGITGQVVTDAKDRWQSVYAEYSNRPQQLGDAYADTYTTVTDTADELGDEWDFGGTSGHW